MLVLLVILVILDLLYQLHLIVGHLLDFGKSTEEQGNKKNSHLHISFTVQIKVNLHLYIISHC